VQKLCIGTKVEAADERQGTTGSARVPELRFPLIQIEEKHYVNPGRSTQE